MEWTSPILSYHNIQDLVVHHTTFFLKQTFWCSEKHSDLFPAPVDEIWAQECPIILLTPINVLTPKRSYRRVSCSREHISARRRPRPHLCCRRGAQCVPHHPPDLILAAHHQRRRYTHNLSGCRCAIWWGIVQVSQVMRDHIKYKVRPTV